MQTEYQHSDHQQNQSKYLTPVHSVATSELSPAVEMGSKVAMILVLLGTIFGSLNASQNAATVSEAETIESTPTTAIEESPVVVEPVEPLSSSPQTETTPIEPVATTSSLESTVETASPTTETTDTTDSTLGSTLTTDTTDSEASAVDLTQPETTTTTDTTDSEISTSSEIPETTATTDPTLSDSEVTSDTTDATASVSVEETTPTPTTATPDMAASTAETQTASKTISATEMEKLNQILYDKIDKTWKVPVSGESVYTVQVTQDGSITGYEPTSQVATNNANNTPLPSLVQSNGSSETLTKEPYAEFEVIFTPTGLLEVKNSTQSDSN